MSNQLVEEIDDRICQEFCLAYDFAENSCNCYIGVTWGTAQSRCKRLKNFRESFITPQRKQFTKVLEETREELVTLHGLFACDGFGAYGRAQEAGLDPVGAWDSFLASTWQLDLSRAILAIDLVLQREETKCVEE